MPSFTETSLKMPSPPKSYLPNTLASTCESTFQELPAASLRPVSEYALLYRALPPRVSCCQFQVRLPVHFHSGMPFCPIRLPPPEIQVDGSSKPASRAASNSPIAGDTSR